MSPSCSFMSPSPGRLADTSPGGGTPVGHSLGLAGRPFTCRRSCTGGDEGPGRQRRAAPRCVDRPLAPTRTGPSALGTAARPVDAPRMKGYFRSVLVVASDPVERDRLSAALEGDGFQVLLCSGPSAPDYSCLGSRVGRCPLAMDECVVVLD